MSRTTAVSPQERVEPWSGPICAGCGHPIVEPETAPQDSGLLLMHGACKGVLWALVSGLLE
jgi:hypothetical protein